MKVENSEKNKRVLIILINGELDKNSENYPLFLQMVHNELEAIRELLEEHIYLLPILDELYDGTILNSWQEHLQANERIVFEALGSQYAFFEVEMQEIKMPVGPDKIKLTLQILPEVFSVLTDVSNGVDPRNPLSKVKH